MTGPFERHLRDAVALNRARAPLYARLSAGASRPISALLIAAEWLLLPVARRFDRAAEPYHRAGVPLLAALFEPMSDVPPFAEHEPWRRAVGIPAAANARAIRRSVSGAFREGGFARAAAVIAAELATLDSERQTNCMVRHLLESAHRLTVQAPSHIEHAKRRGLVAPAPLLGRLLALHLWGLGPAALLDRMARPLQMRGIPILAQDLPIISRHDVPAPPPLDSCRVT